MAASLASGAAVVRARACARARARACARARARARAVLVLVLVLVPCSFCVSSPSCSSCPSWSSFVVLVRGPRCQRCAGSSYFFACLSSCWKSSAGRTPTRQRATFASKVMRSPARRAYLPKRSSQKIHHLAAQSSRAHRPDGANFARSFFFPPQAPEGGGSRRRPSRGQCARPFFPGREPGRTHGASYPVSPLKWGPGPHAIALGKKLAP